MTRVTVNGRHVATVPTVAADALSAHFVGSLARPLIDDNGEPIVRWVECGTCGTRWDEGIVTDIMPTPAARCIAEWWHEEEPDEPEEPEDHYRRDQIARVIDDGPSEDETWFRLVISGQSSSKHLNISPAEALAIAYLLDAGDNR